MGLVRSGAFISPTVKTLKGDKSMGRQVGVVCGILGIVCGVLLIRLATEEAFKYLGIAIIVVACIMIISLPKSESST